MNLLSSVWPVRWFPPFRRGDYADEQVVRRDHFGTYDPLAVPGGAKFETVDFDRGKKIEIEFFGGLIYVRETPVPVYFKSDYQHRVFGELFLEGLRTLFL